MLEATLLKIIQLARHEKKPLANVALKLVEEVGELGEAVNYHEGYLPHKTMKEHLAGEVADVVQCAITLLVKTQPDMSDEDILFCLTSQLNLKNIKWEALIK